MLEDSPKLRLNIDKTRITHVNDGFVFRGHRNHPQVQSLRQHAGGRDVPEGESQKLRGIPDGIVIRKLQ